MGPGCGSHPLRTPIESRNQICTRDASASNTANVRPSRRREAVVRVGADRADEDRDRAIAVAVPVDEEIVRRVGPGTVVHAYSQPFVGSPSRNAAPTRGAELRAPPRERAPVHIAYVLPDAPDGPESPAFPGPPPPVPPVPPPIVLMLLMPIVADEPMVKTP